MSHKSIKDPYKFVDGLPNLSNFDFDYITKFSTLIEASIQKNTPMKHSLPKMFACSYQGLVIGFRFSCMIHKFKDLIIPSSILA